MSARSALGSWTLHRAIQHCRGIEDRGRQNRPFCFARFVDLTVENPVVATD
jgi:hypothetical protein